MRRSTLELSRRVHPVHRVDAIHVGSTTLVYDKGAAETLALIKDARASTTVSFDPNCRPNLVHDKQQYVRRMTEFTARADIVRLSDNDFAFLYGDSEHAAKAKTLLAGGVALFVVTRGIRGAVAWHARAGVVEVEARPVELVDTIGAGDSFQAGLLFALKQWGAWPIGRSLASALTSCIVS